MTQTEYPATPAHELPIDQITLDTPVRIWWHAANVAEALKWTQSLAQIGVLDVALENDHEFLFWTTLRVALENWYTADSVVDGYLPDGAEDHVRTLMAAEGMQDGVFKRRWNSGCLENTG